MLSRNDLIDLLQHDASPAVSIFMPTHRAGRETRQDPIRFKNLLREAKEAFESADHDQDAGEFFAPLERYLDDEDFWAHQADGLCVLKTPDLGRIERLPLTFEERVSVNDRLDVTPLTPLLAWRRPFYVLTLDQQGARLWESQGEALVERELACNDESVESLAPDRRTDGTLQFRSSAESGGNADSPMFHGQAPEDETHEADVKRFPTEVDRCVCDEVGRDPGPLVLACVAELRAAYRGLDPIPEPLEGYIEGSPNDHSPDELYREAIKVVEEFERGARAKLVDRYGDAVGKELTLDDPEEIVAAAGRGQVGTLMLAVPRPGEAKPMCREAIRRVLLSSGDVCTVSAEEMPVDSPLAAILRYTLTPEASSRA